MNNELNALIAAGTIEPLGLDAGPQQYRIPALEHSLITGYGREHLSYFLIVDEQAEPDERYVIESFSSGGQSEELLFADGGSGIVHR